MASNPPAVRLPNFVARSLSPKRQKVAQSIAVLFKVAWHHMESAPKHSAVPQSCSALYRRLGDPVDIPSEAPDVLFNFGSKVNAEAGAGAKLAPVAEGGGWMSRRAGAEGGCPVPVSLIPCEAGEGQGLAGLALPPNVRARLKNSLQLFAPPRLQGAECKEEDLIASTEGGAPAASEGAWGEEAVHFGGTPNPQTRPQSAAAVNLPHHNPRDRVGAMQRPSSCTSLYRRLGETCLRAAVKLGGSSSAAVDRVWDDDQRVRADSTADSLNSESDVVLPFRCEDGIKACRLDTGGVTMSPASTLRSFLADTPSESMEMPDSPIGGRRADIFSMRKEERIIRARRQLDRTTTPSGALFASAAGRQKNTVADVLSKIRKASVNSQAEEHAAKMAVLSAAQCQVARVSEWDAVTDATWDDDDDGSSMLGSPGQDGAIEIPLHDSSHGDALRSSEEIMISSGERRASPPATSTVAEISSDERRASPSATPNVAAATFGVTLCSEDGQGKRQEGKQPPSQHEMAVTGDGRRRGQGTGRGKGTGKGRGKGRGNGRGKGRGKGKDQGRGKDSSVGEGRELCKKHAGGKCTRGSRCHFRHE